MPDRRHPEHTAGAPLNAVHTALDSWRIASEPFYQPQGREVERFEVACAQSIPLLLKGVTGSGKTRFVEYMAWKMKRPLVTVACNEDTCASDLVGRYLLDAQGTVWHDGPLALAARHGAICYLDEVMEARQDTLVVIHPLADTRRLLPIERKGELLQAHPDFQLVVSYNPGYQGAGRDMKPSTRQRFAALDFGHPEAALEARIVARESGVDSLTAERLVSIGRKSRQLGQYHPDEGLSTRMLVRAALLIQAGLAPREACDMALSQALGDEDDLQQAMRGVIDAHFES